MNPDTVHYLNMFLGAGAILLQFFIVITLSLLFFGSANQKNVFLDFISKHFLIISFLIALVASLFSLVYSEIIGFTPCHLCWYQRIFMFPQIFLFGIAFWKKDRGVIKYALPLLVAGSLVSVYQNFGYYFGENSTAPCDSSGVSCYQHLISEFGGYISIPMLALTGFLGIMTVVLVAHFYGKKNID